MRRRGPGAPLCIVNKLFNTSRRSAAPGRSASCFLSENPGRGAPLSPPRAAGRRQVSREAAGPPAARGRGAPSAEVGAAGTQPGARTGRGPAPAPWRPAERFARTSEAREPPRAGEIRGVLNPAAPWPGRYRFMEFSPVGSSAELKLGLQRRTRGCPPARPRGSAALRPPAGRTGPAEPGEPSARPPAPRGGPGAAPLPPPRLLSR